MTNDGRSRKVSAVVSWLDKDLGYPRTEPSARERALRRWFAAVSPPRRWLGRMIVGAQRFGNCAAPAEAAALDPAYGGCCGAPDEFGRMREIISGDGEGAEWRDDQYFDVADALEVGDELVNDQEVQCMEGQANDAARRPLDRAGEARRQHDHTRRAQLRGCRESVALDTAPSTRWRPSTATGGKIPGIAVVASSASTTGPEESRIARPWSRSVATM